jgi:integrating conjugative element protein (TIGR03749 family)
MATEILVWKQKPLEVRLEVGKERIVKFPDNIMLALPAKVRNRMSIDSSAGVAYLTPLAPFPKTRIKVRLATTNELIYIDTFAQTPDDEVPLQDVKIITSAEHEKIQDAKQELFAETDSISLKELVQYATHDFFAPPEFAKLSLPIQESPITKPLNLELMFTGFSAGIFDAKAIKQYRTVNYTLTAIKLTNRTHRTQPIVYSHIENTGYETVSSQHTEVGPKGSNQQSTLLYFVTDRPLSEISYYQ